MSVTFVIQRASRSTEPPCDSAKEIGGDLARSKTPKWLVTIESLEELLDLVDGEGGLVLYPEALSDGPHRQATIYDGYIE